MIYGHVCWEEDKVSGFSAERVEVVTHIGQQEVDILQPTVAQQAHGLL